MKNPKNIINNSMKLIIAFLFLLTVFIVSANYSELVFAQSSTPGSRNLTATNPDEVRRIVDALANSSCPDAIKQLYLKRNSDGSWTTRGDQELYLDGTLIVARDGQNNVILSCASATTLEKILVRIFVLIFSIIGLALAFGAGKSAITMMTAFGDPKKFEEGVRGLKTSIIYTIGAFFFYTTFVFVLVGILGFGTISNKPEYNLFCQQKIIFNLTFDGNLQCKQP